jgi:cytochrome c-type biogenesis protein CcmH/NrfF
VRSRERRGKLPAVKRGAVLLGLAASLLAAPVLAADDHHNAPPAEEAIDLQAHVEGASRLEGRIRAPCCWKTTGQTLDIHGSESAYALRREIRKRLLAGESAEAIEASIVARYGEDILAVPPKSPLAGVAVGLAAAMAAAGAFAVHLLLRWRRRGAAGSGAKQADSKQPAARDELDDRLDAELKGLD